MLEAVDLERHPDAPSELYDKADLPQDAFREANEPIYNAGAFCCGGSIKVRPHHNKLDRFLAR